LVIKICSLAAVIGFLSMGGCSRPSKPLVVGSRLSVENSISGEILAQHIRTKLGVPVEMLRGMMGALSAHQALLTGEIDLYAEDAGSAYYEIFQLPASKDPDIIISRVPLEYQKQKIRWATPLGYPVRYVVAAAAGKVKESTLSQLAEAGSPMAISSTFEFRDRLDGFAAMTSAYNLNFSGAPRIVAPDLVAGHLTETAPQIAVIADTDPVLLDGRIKVLEDDRRVFVPYPVAVVVRERTLESHPKLEGALKSLEGKLSLETIRTLSNSVKTQGKTAAVAAAEFLQRSGVK
jgi:glycine betaine/choline ABC-type transport system substrate-binding protein